MVDVCIVGAGIAGCTCARELSAYNLEVVVLEAGYDVACGSTRANSGIVHGGYDPIPGTLKAKFNVEGSKIYEKLSEELGFEYNRCGSMVVAFSQDEVQALEGLLERGRQNGVEGLEILGQDAIREKEPNLSKSTVAALWVPTGAIVNPYGACLAFAENAVQNGAKFEFYSRVCAIERADGAYRVGYEVLSEGNEPVEKSLDAKIVINAAGLASGEINGFVSKDAFEITPRAGEYLLLDRTWGGAFNSTIFQVPTKNGKGVLVTPTTGGNMLLGPTAEPRESADQTQTTVDGLSSVLNAAGKNWEKIPSRDVITNFAGLRASCLEDGDFHLYEPDDAPGFFNIGGFDSPGLTAAPAVAKEYARIISERLGAEKNENFNPVRKPVKHFATMSDEERAGAVEQDSRWGRVICRCECVTEGEIVEAIHSPIPAMTIDSVKWRTRAGMGRCQSGFCMPLVAQIIARETGQDVTEIRKGGLGSKVAVGRRGCLDRLPHVVIDGGDDE